MYLPKEQLRGGAGNYKITMIVGGSTKHPIFTCGDVGARRSRDHKISYDDLEIVAFGGQRSTGTWVIEATDFKFEVSCNLRGHLEALMASEATK